MEFSVTLARLVDFPTPLTPQNVITKGRFFCLASIASLKISILRFGTKSWTQASSRVFFTVLDIAATSNHVILKYNIKILFMTFQIKLFSSQCKKGFQNFNCQTRTSVVTTSLQYLSFSFQKKSVQGTRIMLFNVRFYHIARLTAKSSKNFPLQFGTNRITQFHSYVASNILSCNTSFIHLFTDIFW